MPDPRKFRAPFLDNDTVRASAENVRQRYPRAQSLPVEVLELAEFDLNLRLEVVADLWEQCSVEAFVMRDMSAICVDRDAFMDEKRQARLRFSVAHELGHFFLHRQIFQELQFTSIEDWVDFIRLVPDDQYGWIEHQAYEFAGRLLVPVDELISRLNVAVKTATAAGYTSWDRPS